MAGFFKMFRSSTKQYSSFSRLWNSPAAYRPGGQRHDRSMVRPDQVLHQLADHANRYGLTAGDAGQIAVEFLGRVDRMRSYDTALLDLLKTVMGGGITTVAGRPLGAGAPPSAIIEVVEATAVAARPEAFTESLERASPEVPRGDTAQAMIQHRIGELLDAYKSLQHDGLLLTEIQELQAIRDELLKLGVDPDEQERGRDD